MKPCHLLVLLLLLIGIAPAAFAAPAFCLPTDVNYRYVGDTASDTNCTDNDIQSAIDNATGVCGNVVIITREHTYTQQHLSIQDRSLVLVGEGDGVRCGSGGSVVCDPNLGCPPPPAAPVVTLDGSGSGGRVLSIGGNSNVTLRYLEVTGGNLGDNPSGDGGGIGFQGTGSLTLDTSTVDANRADYGGGINFNGTGGASNIATLTLDANTHIVNNTADVSGGGIRTEGYAQLFVLAPQTTIFYNHAPGGYGGGIEVIGRSRADIGSPGFNGLPVIYDNNAAYGGGIAIIGKASQDPDDFYEYTTVRVFSTDAANPTRISNNTASNTGGAVYLLPDEDTNFADVDTGVTQFCATDFRIDDNIAAEGSAIYGDTHQFGIEQDHVGAGVYLTPNVDAECQSPEPMADLGAVRCARGVECNTIDGNTAEDAQSQPTSGATILLQDGTGFDHGDGLVVYGLKMRHNHGGHAVRVFDGIGVDIQDCLEADNAFTSTLFEFEGDDNGDPASIRGCTFANNTIGGASLIASSHNLELSESILGDALRPVVMNNGATLYPGSLLAADTAGLPPYDSIVNGLASFVDAANGDYHLLPTSLGIDFAPGGGGTDLDGRPRDVDLASVANNFGPRDLGAYERQSDLACDDNADALFCDGFEAQP
jgi:hypothetical protein